MSCRKPCKECPWKNNNPHSLKFRTYVDKMRTLSKIENHKCHMISSDVWGYQSKVDGKNICIGSKENYEDRS
jgi:hypothetical protein